MLEKKALSSGTVSGADVVVGEIGARLESTKGDSVVGAISDAAAGTILETDSSEGETVDSTLREPLDEENATSEGV